ncbi:MAG: hypothetical protein DRP11_05310, partial [Candidatus Aenigmatarchaeota archaeon]
YEPLRNLSRVERAKMNESVNLALFSERKGRIIEDWINGLPEDAKAVIVENGIETVYEIYFRSDIKDSYKEPNILHLQSETGKRKIIREARKYPRSFLNIIYKNSRYFKRNKHDDKWYDGIGKRRVKPDKNKGIRFIPEPNLVATLENIYDVGIERITPEITVLDIDKKENKLWYIRDFFPSIMDTEFPPARLGVYFGTLHGLGLIDEADREWVHYCYQGDDKTTLVNIDPDFILRYDNGSTLDAELGDIRYEIKTELPHSISLKDMKKFDHHYRLSRKEVSQNIENFMEMIPSILDEDLFPYWKKVDPLCTTHELRKKYSK